MKIKIYLLNAFGVNSKGGNPAGVVLGTDDLTEIQKKYISKEIGYSETAFVQRSNKADFKVTFFTPTEEVDLCGHATIATYTLLLERKLITEGEYTQELNAGTLRVNVKSDGTIIMDQSLPVFYESPPLDGILEIFSIAPEIITQTELKPQIVSTGLKDIFLPVKDRKLLFSLQPDFARMSEYNQKTNTIGFHVFTFDTISSHAIANCRNFAPLYGINEESATGSSTGALACYLFTHGRLVDRQLNNLIFEQGYSMGKPSQIIASLTVNNDLIKRVQIGGKASLIGEKTIDI